MTKSGQKRGRKRRQRSSGGRIDQGAEGEARLTGQEKLNGRTIWASAPVGEKLLPPRTGVEAAPKLQAPATVALSWNSFRQTRKWVSHWWAVQRPSAGSRRPLQQEPLLSWPLEFCMDTTCSSKWPEAWDTWEERGNRWAELATNQSNQATPEDWPYSEWNSELN